MVIDPHNSPADLDRQTAHCAHSGNISHANYKPLIYHAPARRNMRVNTLKYVFSNYNEAWHYARMSDQLIKHLLGHATYTLYSVYGRNRSVLIFVHKLTG